MFHCEPRALLLSATTFVFLGLPTFVACASSPRPPVEVCIDNVCAKSEGVTSPGASGSAIKFHPGHYVLLDGGILSDSVRASHLSQIDELASEPSVKGVALYVYWSQLEGNTAGDYSKGFALIDEYLKHLAPIGKQLILGINERMFGKSIPATFDGGSNFPAYLNDPRYNGGWVVTLGQAQATGSLAAICRVWEQPVMDRLIALTKAYGQRYNSNPNFEMFSLGETAVGGAADFGFTSDAYATQLVRWGIAARQAFQNTGIRLNANFIGSDKQMGGLISSFARVSGAVGGPDVIPSRSIQANNVFNGSIGGIDYRGVLPWVSEVQVLGWKYGNETPEELFNSVKNSMRPSYFVWYRNAWSGQNVHKWTTGILPFIRSVDGSVPGVNCPSAYKDGCISN
jgi:hypothetical protein